MALATNYEDPLKRVMPKVGAPVQNLGGIGGVRTAPLAQRPVQQPAVANGTIGRPATTGAVQRIPAPAPGAVPPLPAAPAPVAPAPVAAAPPVAKAGSGQATAAAAPAASAYTYGSSGGVSPGTSSSLEDQIRNYITQSMGGVTSKAFIDRAKNQLGSAVEGQRAQSVNRINDDAVRRGLFRSGIPAESIAATETGAKSALSSGIADILSNAEQQDIAGRESAAGTAGNLLSSNRSWDQYQQQRADEQAARNKGGGGAAEPTTFTYIDPDTGQSYEMDESWF